MLKHMRVPEERQVAASFIPRICRVSLRLCLWLWAVVGCCGCVVVLAVVVLSLLSGLVVAVCSCGGGVVFAVGAGGGLCCDSLRRFARR